MLHTITKHIRKYIPAKPALAHCDGPCGIYDPASARIAAEAALSMTKKLLALEIPSPSDAAAWNSYNNTFTRFVSIKEEQADIAKKELLILWTDYFKPPHLEAYPNLHEIFWKASKLCSSVKVELSEEHAQELIHTIHNIHEIFWATKNRNVEWYTAS